VTLAARLYGARLVSEQLQRGEIYAETLSSAELQKTQLEAWNTEWNRIIRDVPYFSQLVQSGNLPKHFSSWLEFLERVPITSRAIVQKNGKQMASMSRRPDCYRTTGGSTAQPVQLPAWASEHNYTRPDLWLGRSWYGVRPDWRLFLIWGHSHLLGTGFKRRLNALKRETADRFLGYYRFSAYDLTNTSLRKCAEEMLKFQPNYLLGYSVALDRFARANQPLQAQLRSLGVRVAIGTAEGFPASDSKALLGGLLGCPIAMEYGAVETGVIAHTHPDGNYRVFWRNYFLEVERSPSESGGHRLRITSLYPRCFPLVRYDIGDEIELCDADQETYSIDRFRAVLGRCNDYAELPDGTLIHSEAFTHAIRAASQVLAYQVVQDRGSIQIRLICDQPLSRDSVDYIRSRLKQVHPRLADAEIKRVPCLEQTIAGKIPMVVRHVV
jgi:phenylacetate-CoA ligase